MADINPNALLEFAKTITSGGQPKSGAKLATVTRVDENGTAYVQLPGGEETPIATTGATYNIGDVISVTMFNGKLRATGNMSEPSVSGRAVNAAFKPVQKTAELAKAAANEAAAVAAAINQHFWSDTNGAHVTDVTKDEWKTAADNNFSDVSDLKPYNNLLMNSLGILLRSALNNLVSITRSTIAFYDGQGNNAGNILAQFGSNGATIGKLSSAHSVIDADGQRFYAADGTTQLANIGYGETKSSSGGTKKAPYFTFGHRLNNSEIGEESVAEGIYTTASGHASHAEGLSTVASENMAHAEGSGTTASHYYAHAEGNNTTASGISAHAEGDNTTASGPTSHAEGQNTTAGGEYSHAQNFHTLASSSCQTAIGMYNVEDTNDDYALIVGNGTADNARSNALAVKWDGTVVHGTDITTSVASNILTAASGITFDTAYYAQWGKLAVVTITFKSSSAKSSSWSIGTLASGKRPAIYQRGTISSTSLLTYVGTNGVITVVGSLAANTAQAVTFTYLLA